MHSHKRGREMNKGHKYLVSDMDFNGAQEELYVFLRDTIEEKKLFDNCSIELEGEFIESSATSPHHLVQASVVSVKLNDDLPLENMTIHERLMATGLIHEFKKCFRKDKIRAREILKVLGVSEEYAKEILLRNSYILRFV
ncbi:MAG: hypothetical protein GY816_03355 [Cytophagales bacterium]|nr:hypothetical protein [Cytophagales bacterium]